MTSLRPEDQAVGRGLVTLVYIAAAGLALNGVLHVIRGVSALHGDEPGGARPVVFLSDHLTAWGWIHLVMGAGLLIAAGAVFRGSARGLAAAAIIAAVTAIVGFAAIGFYPAWGIVALILNLVALFAIGTVGTTGPWAPKATEPVRSGPSRSVVAAGNIAMFATAMMLLIGVIQVLHGVDILVSDPSLRLDRTYLLEGHPTAWGWTYITLGALSILTALFLQSGHAWARVTGVAVAAAGFLAGVLWMPHRPAAATVFITLELAIIWALCVFDDERT